MMTGLVLQSNAGKFTLTLATASFERYVRLTRRGAFLAEMERVYRGATYVA